MAKDNIKRRRSESLNLSVKKRYRHSHNIYAEGSLLSAMNQKSKAAFNSAIQPDSLPSSIGAVTGMATSFIDTFKNNADIKDTSGIRSDIEDFSNTDFSTAADTGSLLDQWNSLDWQDTDHDFKDLRASTGERIGNTLSSVASGALTGLQVGGPWGAVAGAAAGLGTGLAGIFVGNKRAKQEANRLNTLAELANLNATNQFANQVTDLDRQNFLNMTSNIVGDGGKIHIKKKNRGKFTAAAKRAGMGVQEYARHVLANKDRYSSTLVKRANFARNASKWHDDGGPLNFNLGEGFLYDYNTDYTEPSRISDTGLSERQNNTEGYMEGYTPRNTPISGLFGDKGRKWGELGWSLGELLPFVGNVMGVADVYNDIRNLAHDRDIDSGDIGNLLLDIAGLIPGVSTITKGAKLAKLAKIGKAAEKLEKVGENLRYATPKGVKDIKKSISDIKDFSKQIDIASKDYKASSGIMDKYNASGREREYKRMVNGLLDGVDRALNPRRTQYYTLQQAGKYADAANDTFGFMGNVEDVATDNKKAMGGSLTHGGNFTNGVTLVNNGGTHEQNPLEGVPMGMDENNVPNLVEEGEVIYNDYVFSNRLYPSEKELISIGLPKKYRKHSFALIAEDLSKESSERPNDPISRRGLEDSLSKLSIIQEMQRQRKGKRGTQRLMSYGGRKYDGYSNIFSSPLKPLREFVEDYFPKRNINIPDIGIPGFNIPDTNAATTAASAASAASTNTRDFDRVERLDPITDPLYTPDSSVSNTYNIDGTERTLTGYKMPDTGLAKETWNRIADNSLSDYRGKSNALPTYLRYAPAVGSAIGALKSLLTEPDYSNSDILLEAANSLSRRGVRPRLLNDYMVYRPLDRNYYLNQLRSQAGATRRAIANAGGNAGSIMAGLLAADYNAQNAVGNTLMQMQQYNDAQRQRVSDFNRGTHQYNAQALMEADAQNAQLAQNRDRIRTALLDSAAQMREATDTALENSRSMNLTNFFDNLGNIGRENFIFNQIGSNSAYVSGYQGLDGVISFKGKNEGKNGGMLTKKRRRR